MALTKLDVYKISRSFIQDCYVASKILPAEERFNMTQPLRRAALSIHLNISEGNSRKSEVDSRRFYEIARRSLIEIDAIPDVGDDLNYWKKENLIGLGENRMRIFQMLSKMIVYPSN